MVEQRRRELQRLEQFLGGGEVAPEHVQVLPHAHHEHLHLLRAELLNNSIILGQYHHGPLTPEVVIVPAPHLQDHNKS